MMMITDGYDNQALIGQYIADKRVDWRPKTVDLRSQQIRYIAAALPVPLMQAKRDHLRAWRATLNGPDETVAAYITTARSFYRWLTVDAELRDDDPALVLHRPHIPEKPPRPMVERNYELALACAVSNPEMYLWLGLMGCSGFRCCEVAWLRTHDIEMRSDGGALAHVLGKGGKRRVVPVGTNLMMTMKPFLLSQGPVFTNAHRAPYRPNRISQRVNEFLRELGITETAHSLRHRFGTDYHSLDSDLYRQAKLMGHASVDTTQRYTEVSPVEAAQHIEALTRRRFRYPGHPGDMAA